MRKEPCISPTSEESLFERFHFQDLISASFTVSPGAVADRRSIAHTLPCAQEAMGAAQACGLRRSVRGRLVSAQSIALT